MSTLEQPKDANECNFSDMKPIEVFEYPWQASKIISEVNSNNILQTTSQIIELITNHKISLRMSLKLIDVFSQIRVKNIKLFTDLYLNISNKFSCKIPPRDEKLETLLYYKGIKFEEFYPKMKEEQILNIYDKQTPLYYIAWDEIDDLKSKFPNLKSNEELDGEITPLDCAIKYGSELCFNYLRNLGAKYTKNSEEYAVQGGNKNIFMQMIEDGKSFNKKINTALKYHNYEVAEYLKSNFGQKFDSVAESMYFGNFNVASFLISNGANINKKYQSEFTEEGYERYIREENPLSIAIRADSIEIIKFLVEHGAKVNKFYACINKRGRDSIHFADCPLSVAIKIDSMESVKFLVEHGADVNKKLYHQINPYNRDYDDIFGDLGNEDECPLSIANKWGSKEIVQYLVEHGATNNN